MNTGLDFQTAYQSNLYKPKEWCKEKDVNPVKAIALKGVSKTGYSDDTVKNHLINIGDMFALLPAKMMKKNTFSSSRPS